MDLSRMAAAADVAPQSAGRLTGASPQAWRYRLDQEIKSALQEFRAVQGPASVAAPGGAAPAPAQSSMSPLPASTAARSPAAPAFQRPHQAGSAPLLPWQAARAYAALSSTPQVRELGAASAKPVDPELGPMHEAAAVLQARLASAGEQWPWRKLHLELEEGGVRAWLRDRGLAEGGPELGLMLQQLQEALSALGLRLLGFTLNGRPVTLA